MKALNLFAAAVVFALTASVARAQSDLDSIDESPSAAAMAFDLVIVRPLSIVAAVAGVGLFVVQLPLSILQGEPPVEPARRFVVEPVKYAIARPLGDMQ
ncbi:hypothetical protein SAMN04488120_106101 [Fontimonas thermophila]|uniref:Multidrug transporter n=1 Tax=Fontimonas thermophila TaxID=1076937 RepID=A0A1I2JC13_9GAMM|nr:hypothetical protein [Fontimonas thermophila]SFF51373.1 hypothetical protein SAMN04488120_106101 [Fontimonas thermophila]